MSDIDNTQVILRPATGMCSLCAETVALPDAELCRECSRELDGALTEAEFDPSAIVPGRPSFGCNPCDCGGSPYCERCYP